MYGRNKGKPKFKVNNERYPCIIKGKIPSWLSITFQGYITLNKIGRFIGWK